jgi:hypothetical protein
MQRCTRGTGAESTVLASTHALSVLKQQEAVHRYKSVRLCWWLHRATRRLPETSQNEFRYYGSYVV